MPFLAPHVATICRATGLAYVITVRDSRRMSITLSELRERTTLTVEEAAEVLSLGRTAAYAAARNGQLPTIRVGRRVVVSALVVLRMLGAETETARDDSTSLV